MLGGMDLDVASLLVHVCPARDGVGVEVVVLEVGEAAGAGQGVLALPTVTSPATVSSVVLPCVFKIGSTPMPPCKSDFSSSSQFHTGEEFFASGVMWRVLWSVVPGLIVPQDRVRSRQQRRSLRTRSWSMKRGKNWTHDCHGTSMLNVVSLGTL